MLADLAAKHGFKFGTLDFGLWTLDFRLWAAELIGWNPLSALPGNLGLEHQFAVYHGLGKGWRLASPRLPPLPGGRAGPLLGVPVAKRVKSGASKSVNSGNLLGCGAKQPCRSNGLRRGCRSARPKEPSPCSIIWLRAKTNANLQAPSNHAPSSNSNLRLTPALPDSALRATGEH